MLRPGDRVAGLHLGWVQVLEPLGEGGQGWVYRVRADAGHELALKWYKPAASGPDQWRALEYLLDRRTPDTRFLWPLDLVPGRGGPEFGYVMPLRPPDYLGFACLVLSRRPDGVPLYVRHGTVIELCRQLAETFLRLHAQGMCYRDINFGNAFFQPETGNVLICDVDNVGIDDGRSRILGTGRFMAPEIVRDVSGKTMPSTLTDRHSLAVMLFYAMFVEHPLEGAATVHGIYDEHHLRAHFGENPLFNLHDSDSRNRTVRPHVERYWNDVYPEFLKKLFRVAFVDGLARPEARVTEGQWLRALVRLRDIMGPCPACRCAVFHDPAAPGRPCWNCGIPLPDPLVLRLAGRDVVVGPDMVLRAVEQSRPGDAAAALGRGIAHPADPGRTGLHNLGPDAWSARYPDGAEQAVRPGQAAELTEGLEIGMPGGVARVVRRAEPSTSAGEPR